MDSGFQFPAAVSTVSNWLNDATNDLSVKQLSKFGKCQHDWEIGLAELGYPVSAVRLSIGAHFPAEPCELYVDVKHFLVLPHVEESGKVCLDEICQPDDFDDPVGAILRALKRFRGEFLQHTRDAEWQQDQLRQERLSYWWRFCDSYKSAPQARRVPQCTLVSMPDVTEWEEGSISAYIANGSKHRRITEQIVTHCDVDSTELAQRHGLASGTRINGHAVFVRIPEGSDWRPSTWPRSFLELEHFVLLETGGRRSVSQWLKGMGWEDKSPGALERLNESKVPMGAMPLLVVLCKGRELYGYQILPVSVSLLSQPHVAPLKMVRIDPDWSLARDHGLPTIHARRKKRVLFLGCGSLGSTADEILARSGVGEIDLVDVQLMAPENAARHALGLSDIRRSKALRLAARLTKDIPGVVVRGHHEDAFEWMVAKAALQHFDLVVDCSAESSIRMFIARKRGELLGNAPVMHAWVEPFCAAAHVVASTHNEPWPPSDPADSRVNVADYSAATTRVALPACSDGFHPYGSADIVQAAGFTAERIIYLLDHPISESTVWSLIRTRAFFDSLNLPIHIGSLVPAAGTLLDSTTITRPLAAVLAENG